uniref:Uncharacterized protein n=1 Tax=Arundo donax TaxID=35708 RepID=A0A0A9CLE2_ARUDO
MIMVNIQQKTECKVIFFQKSSPACLPPQKFDIFSPWLNPKRDLLESPMLMFTHQHLWWPCSTAATIAQLALEGILKRLQYTKKTPSNLYKAFLKTLKISMKGKVYLGILEKRLKSS